MNKDFVAWLSTQRLPMFDIRKLYGGDLWTEGRFMTEAYEVYQEKPQKRAVFECGLDELLGLVQQHFPQLQSAVGELAVKTAIEDLRLEPWWSSAGPITEEIRYLLREGFKNLPALMRSGVLRSPVKHILSHSTTTSGSYSAKTQSQNNSLQEIAKNLTPSPAPTLP